MDVTPPTTLRRLGIALAGVAVAALTGAACALSFDDLRALAIRGEARADLAYLYPAAFDALLVVALISLLLLRSARLLVRLQTATVLVLLIVAAAAANVTTALGLDVAARPAAVGVAIAPWVMLALALWLWLLLIKHVQDRRAPHADADDGTAEHDLVPFHRGGPAEAPPPLARTAQPVLEPTPVVGPTAAPETPPISERVTSWPTSEPARVASAAHEPAPAATSEPAASAREAAHEPVDLPAPADEFEGEVGRDRGGAHEPDDTPEPGDDRKSVPEPRSAAEFDPAIPPAHATGHEAEPAAAEEPEERRPVRWGDRVKPADVLVHPRTTPDKDADTQPVRVFTDAAEEAGDPDPDHGPEAADTSEGRRRESDMEDTAPHPIVHDTDRPDRPAADAPSGRLRSTPLPPEE
ncbi:DUF2637 domain-containing protein [Nonomuraea sp. NPDC048916]|uniref:DUF2637 domain-containing protein n=1 Tax=Nonomuraea sp. NPDC048916 TaxID=3154232 RepID=UPI0033D9D723